MIDRLIDLWFSIPTDTKQVSVSVSSNFMALYKSYFIIIIIILETFFPAHLLSQY